MENKKVLKRFIMTSTFAGAFLAAPVIGEAALGDQTLKQGNSHTDVKELQSILKSKGYFHYQETTTYFGPITKKAVMDFQKANGLVVDGIVGKKTYDKLLQKTHQEEAPSVKKPTVQKPTVQKPTVQKPKVSKPPVSSTKPASSSKTSKVLKLNTTGPEVKKLQTDLKTLGFFTFYKTTDFYGTITTEAVRKFQINQKLKATGTADQVTLNQIQKLIAGKKKPVSQPKPIVTKPTSPSKETVLMKFGSTGTQVMQLQTRLKKLGYFKYHMITDYYGTVTEDSVERFQKANSLPVTGEITSSVLNKITEVEKKKGQKPSNSRNQTTINIIANASEYMGVPYVWGGTTPKGFDCSGFIQYVYAQEGIQLPRTVAQMWNATSLVSKPVVGDLVYFETYTSGPSHLGIYIGNNQFVHAGSSTGVTVSDMNLSYWKSRYLGAKRVNY
ncbi:peptidoglycan-binding protein [Fictibacillus nanhaiensis]|uniref:Peptidoglycan-binding protein n=1 Tax=Fictibacillus nanhaiensis TaxID=742169 RepID=A0ABS2ZMT7_9BACL|nr:peptidoglycan-binding protein [Fictibacillus nanhaiensis]